MKSPIPPDSTPATLTSFRVGSRTYERRYVDCGKEGCHRCNRGHYRRPTHGPYWYLCFAQKGSWIRIYQGKELDTTKFVTADGRIDFAAIRARKTKQLGQTLTPGRRRDRNEKAEHTIPGQTDMVDDIPPVVAGGAQDPSALEPDTIDDIPPGEPSGAVAPLTDLERFDQDPLALLPPLPDASPDAKNAQEAPQALEPEDPGPVPEQVD